MDRKRRVAAKRPTSTGLPAPTPKAGRNLLGFKSDELTLKKWDGQKHVEINLDEIVIIKSDPKRKGPKARLSKKRTANQDQVDSKTLVIKSRIADLFDKIEDASTKQQIFSELAAESGLQISPALDVGYSQANDQSDVGLGKAFRQSGAPVAPATAPALFRDRSDKSMNAEEFLKATYDPWLRGNGLYQHSLRKLDPQLMKALDNLYQGRRTALVGLLPTKQAETDDRLKAALGDVPQGKDRKHALGAMSKGHRPLARKP